MSGPRLRVAVLSGGPSREHDVSVGSGRAVVEALAAHGHHVFDVHVDRDGRWRLPGASPAELPAPPGAALARLGDPGDSAAADVVFIALHGSWGEDGTLQGLLETLRVPYTGSGVLASALAMDKERTKEVLAHHGLRTPPWVGVDVRTWTRERAHVLARLRGIEPPYVVKPAREGSSFGVTLVDDAEGLVPALETALDSPGARALVEHRIVGTELTCPVLGNHDGELRTLPLVEIVPEGRAFFDFAAKYEGASREICPARVGEDVAERVRAAGLLAHRVLGCDGVSRSDFIVDAHGAPWFLETNTVPGMTPQSLCPLAARAAGMSFDAFCDVLVRLALDRAARAR